MVRDGNKEESFQHSAYQANKKFVVELSLKEQSTDREIGNDTYSGERLSLNWKTLGCARYCNFLLIS